MKITFQVVLVIAVLITVAYWIGDKGAAWSIFFICLGFLGGAVTCYNLIKVMLADPVRFASENAQFFADVEATRKRKKP